MSRFTRLIGLKSSIVFGVSQNAKRTLMTSKALSAGFTKDFKPGPYPKTEKERIAAAKKYGLRPEDYKPYPDDGLGYGDYPQLPPISPEMKSDWTEWDDPYHKRNFGEPVLIGAEQTTPEKVSLKQPTYSFKTMLFALGSAATLFFGLGYLLEEYKFTVPLAPKQYPRNVKSGEKHYEI